MDKPDQKGSLTMQTRTTRARGIAAVGLLTALASAGALAQTLKTPPPEKSLLGVRLLASYKDVLAKFGQPNEIQVGDPTVSGQGQLAATGGASSGSGGYPGLGLPGMSGGPMGGGKGMSGMPMGMGSGMPPGMAGRSMGGGPMGSGMPMGMGSGMPPGMGPGAIPGMANRSPMGSGMPMGMGSGMPPGMAGGPMGMGGSGMPMGMAGRGMGGYNNTGNTVEDPGETTWWYHYPKQGLHYSFLFDKEGKVIQIQAYGQQPSPKIVAPRSAQGITLGTDFGQVIRKYGWSNDGEHAGDYVVMRYGKEDRIAFQSRHNKVLGIVLGRVNPEPPRPTATAGYPGGGNPGMGGSNGAPAGDGGDGGM
jgi:hypothetical protein